MDQGQVQEEWLVILHVLLHELDRLVYEVPIDPLAGGDVVQLDIARGLSSAISRALQYLRFTLHQVWQLHTLRIKPERPHKLRFIRRARDSVPMVEAFVARKAARHVAEMPLSVVGSRIALVPEQLREGDLCLIQSLRKSGRDRLATPGADRLPPSHES